MGSQNLGYTGFLLLDRHYFSYFRPNIVPSNFAKASLDR